MNIAVFKVNQLGDNVMFLPVVQSLRRLYPQWEMLLFTSPLADPLFAADVPATRRIVRSTAEFNGAWRHPACFLSLLRKVREHRPNGCLLSDDQGNVAHLLARLSGARVRVGAEVRFLKFPPQLTRALPFPRLPPRAALYNWEIARAFVEALGGREWPDVPPRPDLSHLLAGALAVPGRVVIHPGASRDYQRWPLERFVQLAQQLVHTSASVQWIESSEIPTPELPPEIERVRPASIPELVRALAGANLFVGNNSGPMNIVFALGRPAVILNGPTTEMWDPIWNAERIRMLRDRSLPCLPCDRYTHPVQVCTNVAEPMACMRHWSVDTVAAICEEWLARWPAVTPQDLSQGGPSAA